MILIVIIIALVLERTIGSLDEYRQTELLTSLREWLIKQSKQLNSPFGAFLALGIVGAGVQFLYITLYDWIAILGYALACIVLVFCFGPKNYHEQVKTLCEAVEAGNMESACWQLERIKYHTLHEDEKKSVVATTLQTIFVAVNNRILGVIFWFIVLGPIGAIIYRMSSIYHFQRSEEIQRPGFNAAFDNVYYWLNWPCARLVALSYAVVGSFTDVIKHLKGSVTPNDNWPDANESLLVNTGLGAMHLDQTNKDLNCEDITNGLALVRRSVAFWVGAIALMTLAGWLG
jgi:cobalamin biosynthesis protein CobD/CbiB